MNTDKKVGNSKFTCDQCSRVFISKQKLENHKGTSLYARGCIKVHYKCEICGFYTENKSEYDRHLMSAKHKQNVEIHDSEPSKLFVSIKQKYFFKDLIQKLLVTERNRVTIEAKIFKYEDDNRFGVKYGNQDWYNDPYINKWMDQSEHVMDKQYALISKIRKTKLQNNIIVSFIKVFRLFTIKSVIENWKQNKPKKMKQKKFKLNKFIY